MSGLGTATLDFGGSELLVDGSFPDHGESAKLDTFASIGPTAGSANVSITIAANSNRVLVVFIHLLGNSNVSGTASGAGASWSRRLQTQGGIAGFPTGNSSVWVGIAPSTGAQTITISKGTATSAVVIAYSLYDANQSDPLDKATAFRNTDGGTPAIAGDVRRLGVASVQNMVGNAMTAGTPTDSASDDVNVTSAGTQSAVSGHGQQVNSSLHHVFAWNATGKNLGACVSVRPVDDNLANWPGWVNDVVPGPAPWSSGQGGQGIYLTQAAERHQDVSPAASTDYLLRFRGRNDTLVTDLSFQVLDATTLSVLLSGTVTALGDFDFALPVLASDISGALGAGHQVRILMQKNAPAGYDPTATASKPPNEPLGGSLVTFASFASKQLDQATAVVTGQGGIVSGSPVEAWLQGDSTSDHSADEHISEPLMLRCGSVVAATGFTIYGQARRGRVTGQFTAHWAWFDS